MSGSFGGEMHQPGLAELNMNIHPNRKCSACDVSDIEWKCTTCNMMICYICMKGHQKFPATASHEIRSIKSVADEIISQLRQDRDKYKTYETEIINRLTRSRQYKDYLVKMKTKIKKDIDSATTVTKKKLIHKLEHESENLKKDVTKAIKGETDDIVEIAIRELSEQLDKLKMVSTTLTELISNKDYVQIVNNFGDDSPSVLPKVIYALSKHDMSLQLEIKLQPTSHEFVEEIYVGDLEIAHTDFIPEDLYSKDESRPLSRCSASYYSQDRASARHNSRPLTLYRQSSNPLVGLLATEFTYEYSVKLPHSCTRMEVIGNDLYCAGRDVHLVSVLNTSGVIKSSICHGSMRFPMKAAEAGDSIFIACDEGFGLLEFDKNGLGLISTVARGNFSDVTSSGEEVYALECIVGKVMIFWKNPENKKWEVKDEIKIEYLTSSNQDTLLVNKGKIYISASRNKCVYVYGRNGVLANTYRSFVQNVYSSSWHILKLCCIDAQGSLLVADQTDGAALVVEREDKLSKLNINVGVTPNDILIADDNTLWLVEDRLVRAFKSK